MALPRESTFLPSITCSTCGNDVPISMMGQHECTAEPFNLTPPLEAKEKFSNTFTSRNKPMTPPPVDTRGANGPFMRQGQLTPVSHSSESRNASPRTPNGRAGTGRTDDYYAPEIANPDESSHSPRSNGRRPGGYGGFTDSDVPEPPQPPKSLANNDFMQRMNNIASNPFDSGRRPSTARNAFPQRKDSLERWEPPPDEGFAPAKRQNGYGGFANNAPPAPTRADTYPRPNISSDYEPRRPSAPSSQQDRSYQPTGYEEPRVRVGPDTTRRPPPRPTSIVKHKGSNSVDLAKEFGVRNPYHSSTGSGSSSSDHASSDHTDMSRESFSSAITSPERTPPQRYASNPRDMGRGAVKPQPPRHNMRPTDLRIDPAVQAPFHNPPGMVESPYTASPQDEWYDPAIQHGLQDRRPSPNYGAGPRDNGYGRNGNLGPSPTMYNNSRDQRWPSAPASRGDCKACSMPIIGKSISSADGRLTGKYHKACFVCTTCSSPFASAEFYVHNDKPYCEQHYHKLNGSLCGSCGRGIEGQYLEDETMVKYHPGCFCCLDCGRSLSDGYFEVEGRSYCERDAWRRVELSNRMPNVDPNAYPAPPPVPGDGMNRRPSNTMPRPSAAVGMQRGPYGVSADSQKTLKMNKRMTRIGMMK